MNMETSTIYHLFNRIILLVVAGIVLCGCMNERLNNTYLLRCGNIFSFSEEREVHVLNDALPCNPVFDLDAGDLRQSRYAFITCGNLYIYDLQSGDCVSVGEDAAGHYADFLWAQGGILAVRMNGDDYVYDIVDGEGSVLKSSLAFPLLDGNVMDEVRVSHFDEKRFLIETSINDEPWIIIASFSSANGFGEIQEVHKGSSPIGMLERYVVYVHAGKAFLWDTESNEHQELFDALRVEILDAGNIAVWLEESQRVSVYSVNEGRDDLGQPFFEHRLDLKREMFGVTIMTGVARTSAGFLVNGMDIAAPGEGGVHTEKVFLVSDRSLDPDLVYAEEVGGSSNRGTRSLSE